MYQKHTKHTNACTIEIILFNCDLCIFSLSGLLFSIKYITQSQQLYFIQEKCPL